MLRRSSNASQVHIPDESTLPRFDEVHIPPNLVVARPLRQIIEAMLRDSPTFRRQCARLGRSSSLTISVDHVLFALRARSQAVTDFSIDDEGRRVARVQLGQAADREEVLAHEFEHIIEQLDGVDLASLAKSATASVRRTDADRFETERAIAAGRQVVREIRTARRSRM